MDISALLEELDHGGVNRAASSMLAEVVQAVQKTGNSGELSLKFKVSKEGDKAVVKVDAVHKVPRDPLHSTLFYFGQEGNLERDDPRQMTLKVLAEPKRADQKETP